MPRSVAVFSKIPNLISKLREVLPSVNFIEIQSSSDLTPLQSSEILIGDFDLVGPQIYNLPKLKWLQGTWAGIDLLLQHIEKENAPKFLVTRTSGENFGLLMGEYIYSNIVFYERNFLKVKENQNKKIWDPDVCPRDHRSIAELTIGILGTGSIGNISKTLKYLGATIYGFGRRSNIPLENDEYKHIKEYFTKTNLPEFLNSVDYVVNILPNTSETKNILGDAVLENCKGRNTVFINIGRGSVIAEWELVHALKEKWISGAILDVFETEPLSTESFLWALPNRTFPNQWIGRYPAIPWPARSPDLTPCDFFIWGLLKEKVYLHSPFQNVDHLEAVIRHCVQEFTPAMVREVVAEFSRRTIVCMEKDGAHVEE